MKSLANNLREAVYKIMSAFHTLTGCYYIVPFFGQCKYSIFKNIQKHSNAKRLLLSLNIEGFKVPDFIDSHRTQSTLKMKIMSANFVTLGVCMLIFWYLKVRFAVSALTSSEPSVLRLLILCDHIFLAIKGSKNNCLIESVR